MWRALFVCLALTLPLAAEVANLSGKWLLNVKRSTWGSKAKPNKVVLMIDHNEPKLKYSGQVEAADETTSDFEFDGAIDGREYNLKDGNLTHKMHVKRISDDAISSEARYADGKTQEFAVTKLADNGKTLVRTIRLKTATGTIRWREIYERMP